MCPGMSAQVKTPAVPDYFLSLYPVLNIHQTVTRHTPRNSSVIPTLTLWLTSEISKKLQRKSADQINDRIEQRDGLPYRRQHAG